MSNGCTCNYQPGGVIYHSPECSVFRAMVEKELAMRTKGLRTQIEEVNRAFHKCQHGRSAAVDKATQKLREQLTQVTKERDETWKAKVQNAFDSSWQERLEKSVAAEREAVWQRMEKYMKKYGFGWATRSEIFNAIRGEGGQG